MTTTKIFSIPSLSSHEVTEVTLKQLASASPRPSMTRVEYDEWKQRPSTRHHFFSTVEGMTPTLRVTAMNGNNRPVILHGVVADYDADITKEMRERAITKMAPEWAVAAHTRTFSGGARLIWVFDKPVNLYNEQLTKEFLKRLHREMKLGSKLPGLDTGAFEAVGQYYELGTEWTLCGGVVKSAMVNKVMLDASGKVDWRGAGVTIPIGDVAAEVAKRYPGAWTGDFDVGVRGPRFWDPSAEHDAAVIIRESGVQYFTDGGGFKTWTELLGASWVKQYQASRVGNLIQDVWYDGKHYYIASPDGGWQEHTLTTIQRYLQVSHAVDTRPPKGSKVSEMTEVLAMIEREKRIKTAQPFVFRHDPVRWVNGERILNTATVRPMKPVDEPCEWGHGFPFIADWLGRLFWDDHQLAGFLSWLHWSYVHALAGTPRKGQALFIAGGRNRGKTLLNHRVISAMHGGGQDASSYLLSEDKFTGNLFSVGIWHVDDEVASTDQRSHTRFSNMIKRLVANNELICRQLYKDGAKIEWEGRIVITLNEDPESIRMLPTMEISNADKLMILRCSPTEFDFPFDVEDVIRRELPFFCRYVHDYQIPPEWKGQARFGVKEFVDPWLLEASRANSVTTATEELLDRWRNRWFLQPGKDNEQEWFGNATDLLESVSDSVADAQSKLLDGVNRQRFGQFLSALIAQDLGWIRVTARDGRRGYKITRPGFVYGPKGDVVEANQKEAA